MADVLKNGASEVEVTDLRHKLLRSSGEHRKRRNSDRNSNYHRNRYDNRSDYPHNRNYNRNSETSDLEREITARKILADTYQNCLFDNSACLKIEEKINEYIELAENKITFFKKHTVDKTPLRVKFFFGEGYTYGSQMERRGPGMERLYAKGDVDEIPSWITDLITKPLVKEGILDEGFVNSAAVNVYQPGGCIASHIDPPHIFHRPIVSVSFFSHCALSFGCRFTYKPLQVSEPVLALPISRGCVTKIFGFASDEITHCIRPVDVVKKRAVVILRRVKSDAPRVTSATSVDVSSDSDYDTPPGHSVAPPGKRRSTEARVVSLHPLPSPDSDVSPDSDDDVTQAKRSRRTSHQTSHKRHSL